MHKAIAGLAVVGALLLVVTGCGSDDSSLSKQEYDQQLELVCNQGLQEREELLEDVGREFEERQRQTDPDFQASSIRRLIAIYDGTTDEIADLGLPDQGEQKAEELVQAREDAAAKVEADPLGSREKLVPIFSKANKVAEELEAKSCAT